MFGMFKKDPSKERPKEEYEGLCIHHYEGQILSPEYNVNNPDAYPFHAIYPHGYGKIIYKFGNDINESYEGEFVSGQYSGQGKLIKDGEVFEGTFSKNKFVGSSGEPAWVRPRGTPYDQE